MTYKIKTISFGFVFLLSFIAIPLIFIFFLTREVKIDFWIVLIISIFVFVLIHRMCSGVLELHLENDIFQIKWITKPLLTNIKEQRIKFDEINKWDNIGNPRGPDAFLIVLKDKRRIRIWFRLFATKNNYEDFQMDFVKWININKEVYQNTLKDNTAVNITEDFYNSKKSKIFSVILMVVFTVDILLIILNPWNARLVFIVFLFPLVLWSMFHLIGSILFKKK